MHLRPHPLNAIILNALHSHRSDHMLAHSDLYYAIRQAGILRWLTEHHVTRSSARIHDIMAHPFQFTPPDFTSQHAIDNQQKDGQLGYSIGIFRTEHISIPLQIEHTNVVGSADYPYVYIAYSFDNNDHLAFEITADEAATLNLILRKRSGDLALNLYDELPDTCRGRQQVRQLSRVYHTMLLRHLQMFQPIRYSILGLPRHCIALPLPAYDSVTYRDTVLDRILTAISIKHTFNLPPPDTAIRDHIVLDAQGMPYFRFIRPGCPEEKVKSLSIVDEAIRNQNAIHAGYIEAQNRCVAVTAIHREADGRWTILLAPRTDDTAEPVRMTTTDQHMIIDITEPGRDIGEQPPRTADNPYCIRQQAASYMANDYTAPVARILLDTVVEQGGSPDQGSAYIQAWLNQKVTPRTC